MTTIQQQHGSHPLPERPLAIELYRQMARIRQLEERIAELYPEQEMRCPVHLCIGQEAISAGVCAALERTDKTLSAHRSHGHYLAKGGDMNALLAEIYGKADGCSGGKGGSMHLTDPDAGFVGATPIMGSTVPIAVGLAFAASMRGESTVAASFFGEAVTEEGILQESMLFASLKNLPMVFVCENNLFSVYSPLQVRQPPQRDRCAIARDNGLTAAHGDGNDVVEVYTLAAEAVDRARSGGGPTFLEFDTYRWREHCGPNYDNHLPYREESEFETWRERDPLPAYRARLTDEGGVDAAELAEIDEAVLVEVEAAFDFARQSPEPGPERFATHVYA